ncbi:hypothetical protein [Coleofasciculus sp. FACHB-SPT36]|uniref:hypothetical protein n=1 Tax=Coleofasciculus sp. FACHB-SPT36 TaxID=2692790 RepID=UPI001A7F0E78|nr:hypothetical protein [Coleofasciculus sp. FACHB-SPT36]
MPSRPSCSKPWLAGSIEAVKREVALAVLDGLRLSRRIPASGKFALIGMLPILGTQCIYSAIFVA